MKSNPELIQWLRDNSSGSYRPSGEAVDRLETALHLLRKITQDLPQKRDWLNPDLEREAKALLVLDNAPAIPDAENGHLWLVGYCESSKVSVRHARRDENVELTFESVGGDRQGSHVILVAGLSSGSTITFGHFPDSGKVELYECDEPKNQRGQGDKETLARWLSTHDKVKEICDIRVGGLYDLFKQEALLAGKVFSAIGLREEGPEPLEWGMDNSPESTEAPLFPDEKNGAKGLHSLPAPFSDLDYVTKALASPKLYEEHGHGPSV